MENQAEDEVESHVDETRSCRINEQGSDGGELSLEGQHQADMESKDTAAKQQESFRPAAQRLHLHLPPAHSDNSDEYTSNYDGRCVGGNTDDGCQNHTMQRSSCGSRSQQEVQPRGSTEDTS